ncbi:MAG: SDR family oxidoreductase [Deltaproteobacteria bacterium]|nr:SDR family oxidoreductase [Deltaproteobacteria bacterium]
MKTKKVETALVIGGGSGMGRAVAEALGQKGVHLFVADLDLDASQGTVRAISEKGGRAEAFVVDVSQRDSVVALFEGLKERAERLDLMVNTAAILGRTVFIEDMEDQEWREMIAVNLDGMFYCCREAVRWMKAHRTGRIVLFSSVASLTPTPGALHYSASKGGVNMMGKTLAQEAAKYNIRVNVIAPGYVDTAMLDGLPEGFSDYVLKRTPLRRMGEVEEIAGLVSFLASPEADFMTGQVLSPNGGFVI